MASSKNGGPSGAAFPTKKGRGAGTLRGKQNPPDNTIASIHTGKTEIQIPNRNGLASVYRYSEDRTRRK